MLSEILLFGVYGVMMLLVNLWVMVEWRGLVFNERFFDEFMRARTKLS